MHFPTLFPSGKALIGMVHLHAMPGTPAYAGSVQAILDAALRDAHTLKAAGFDAVLLENMHDLPYLNGEVGHEVSSVMSVAGYLIKNAFKLPTGIQVLAGANQAALACALAANLDFIRAEAFVYGHLADEGWMNAQAGPLLRYRKQIDAQHIGIYCDIKKKHSAHAASADVGLVDTAKAAEFFKADGIIITGKATGEAASLAELESLRDATGLPLIVGSGIDVSNAAVYARACSGMIVGSSIKVGADWRNPVDAAAAGLLAATVKTAWQESE